MLSTESVTERDGWRSHGGQEGRGRGEGKGVRGGGRGRGERKGVRGGRKVTGEGGTK